MDPNPTDKHIRDEMNALDNTGETVLSMIRSDIKDIRTAIKEHQAETKEEFRRVRDKIDSIHDKYSTDSKTSAIDLKVLETKHEASAKYAGRIAGAVSGFFTAVAATIIGAVAKYFLDL